MINKVARGGDTRKSPDNRPPKREPTTRQGKYEKGDPHRPEMKKRKLGETGEIRGKSQEKRDGSTLLEGFPIKPRFILRGLLG